MKNSVTCGVFALLVLLRVSSCDAASILTFRATLNGTNVVPANSSPGTGIAIVTIDLDTSLLSFEETWTDLVANATGQAGHIHCCALPGANGTLAIVFPGFPMVTAGSYSRTVDLLTLATYNAAFRNAHGGTAEQAKADLLAGLAAGTAYAEVLTPSFPGGEIRGNLQAVPETTSMVLMSIGLCGLAWLKRRRSHGYPGTLRSGFAEAILKRRLCQRGAKGYCRWLHSR